MAAQLAAAGRDRVFSVAQVNKLCAEPVGALDLPPYAAALFFWERSGVLRTYCV